MNYALLAFLTTSMATTIGAFPAIGFSKISPRFQNATTGFSAGVMLAATCFSLLLPALDIVNSPESTKLSTFYICASFLCGGLFLKLLNQVVPHEHFGTGREGSERLKEIKKIWLFVFAITLHNLPEGLAVGSGAGSQSPELAYPIMLGIAIQDAPEGFVVAVALISIGYKLRTALLVAAFSGVVEGIAALLGYAATSQVSETLPWALAFSGGAMLYVISEEIIPESHRKENADLATAGLMLGFALMMFLDTALAMP
ncbi:MAG: ZIP family metal transporter [Halobacteriovoraceae bacterium]|nr:ZIP family metal transporter [Halobacteriovoraceae bacterium]|tara:strand:- start:26668 stop:27438 length:771 start_codon:yes stop_codon:yes gene_type:complete